MCLPALEPNESLFPFDDTKRNSGFVCAFRGWHTPLAIECKWSADSFDPANLSTFHPNDSNSDLTVVAADVSRSYVRRYGTAEVEFVSLPESLKQLAQRGRADDQAGKTP